MDFDKELQIRRIGYENLLRMLNRLFTGDEKSSFYALDLIFAERPYLIDRFVLGIFQGILNDCIAEKERYLMNKRLKVTEAEFYLTLEAIDSCIFVLEEIMSYAKEHGSYS